MNIVALNYNNVAYACLLAKEMHAFSTFATDGPEFDWDYTFQNMTNTIHMPDYYFRLAHDDEGVYVGAVCGKVIPYYFSPELQGIEEAWYVREGTPNRAKIAKELMSGFVYWCVNIRGALIVQSGDIANISPLAVDTLYKHMGFERYGSAYKFTKPTHTDANMRTG